MGSEGSGPSIYVASPLGFTSPGSRYLLEVLHPALLVAGYSLLDPWASGAQIIGRAPEGTDPRELNAALGETNAELIRACSGVLAVLDGSDVDSGTASEIGFASALDKVIVGFRSDFRMAGDNADTPVNLQVMHFIMNSGGTFTTTLDEALSQLQARVPTNGSSARLFHIASRSHWRDAMRAGRYLQSTRDQRLDEVGFIHCSFRGQLDASANRFYDDADPEDLVVLVIDPGRLDMPLVVEQAGNEDAFPHIYGPLNPAAVIATCPLGRIDGHLTMGPPTKP
jgi:uncharacterized protein (DUF952 family)